MSPTALFRWSGLAALVSGLLILVQRAVLDALWSGNVVAAVPGSLAAGVGVLGLMGLYLRQRQASGVLGVVGFAVNCLGLVLVASVDFSRHYVLRFLSTDVLRELLAGPTRFAFLASGLVFLAGVVLFSLATFRAGVFSRFATALYLAGFGVFSVSRFLPDFVAPVAQVAGAIGIAWLGAALLQARAEIAPSPDLSDAHSPS